MKLFEAFFCIEPVRKAVNNNDSIAPNKAGKDTKQNNNGPFKPTVKRLHTIFLRSLNNNFL
jgi:hypothetical protein